MTLYAISDLHLGYKENREAFNDMSVHANDWLILGGDLGESQELLKNALELTVKKFAKVFWIPGNHELWSVGGEKNLQGDDKYQSLVACCRSFDVLTPEDPYFSWDDHGTTRTIAPLFLLYDYSFRPDTVLKKDALDWAMEHGLLCADEHYLKFSPYQSKEDWCQQRCVSTHARLKEVPKDNQLILVNHFPLRYDQVIIPRIPRFSIWCGTKNTEQWHKEFNVSHVVYGHLHFRKSYRFEDVQFDEVSLGNPRQWDHTRHIDSYLRKIL